MRFQEVSDEQWEFIKPLLPPPARSGRPRADDRRTLNAVLYVLTTGCRWMDLPEKYGSKSTAHDRLKKWEEQGVWRKLLDKLIELEYSLGKVRAESLAVDSSTIPAKKGER